MNWLQGITIALALGSSMQLHAAQRVHTVKSGDSLQEISTRYFGVMTHAELIQRHNQMKSTHLREGQQLEIPIAEVHTVKSGNTWSGLASRYWHDADLHRVMAELVADDPEAPLKPGRKLRIPALARYRLQKGETLIALSRKFLGHGKGGDTLGRLNGISDPRRLHVGQKLRIPFFETSKLTEEKTPPVSAPPPVAPAAVTPPSSSTQAPPTPKGLATQAPPTPKGLAEAALSKAINRYLEGDYDDALKRLEALQPEIEKSSDIAMQRRLLRHLTFVYAAFDRADGVCTTYNSLLKIEPKPEWNPDQVSPKVLNLLALCDRS